VTRDRFWYTGINAPVFALKEPFLPLNHFCKSKASGESAENWAENKGSREIAFFKAFENLFLSDSVARDYAP